MVGEGTFRIRLHASQRSCPKKVNLYTTNCTSKDLRSDMFCVFLQARARLLPDIAQFLSVTKKIDVPECLGTCTSDAGACQFRKSKIESGPTVQSIFGLQLLPDMPPNALSRLYLAIFTNIPLPDRLRTHSPKPLHHIRVHHKQDTTAGAQSQHLRQKPLVQRRRTLLLHDRS